MKVLNTKVTITIECQCGGVQWLNLKQIGLMKKIYCEFCDKQYDIPTGLISKESSIGRVTSKDENIVRNTLKHQNYNLEQIDKMLESALSEGDYDSPEELLRRALCNYDQSI